MHFTMPIWKNSREKTKKIKISAKHISDAIAILNQVVKEKGLINKEIADKLNISLTTVITHRKNITEKLGILLQENNRYPD